MLRYLLFVTLCCLVVSQTTAQQSKLDNVFVLGEAEKQYETLTADFSRTMLEATDNDIQKAFSAWMDFLQFVEKTAEAEAVDIKGIKLWMHVFLNPDGTIHRLGFLLRPESRTMPNGELKALLATVVDRYQLPITSANKFNHYSGASFPVITEESSN